MKKKKTFRNIALATAGMTLASGIPFQAEAVALDNQTKTTSVDLKNADIRMAVGESQTLKAVADFLEDKNNSGSYKIEWSVNEESKKVLSVDSRGRVTAKAAGKAEITAILKGETNLKATVSVDVYSTVTALNVKNKVINLRVGEQIPIEYQISPTAIEKGVKFVSDSNPTAKVDNKGLVTGIAEGEAKILVSTLDAGPEPFTKPITEEVTVKVTSTVTGVEVTNVPNKKLALKSDETFQLKWNVLPSTAFLKDVTFKSSNNKAATVNSKGVITGTKMGGSTEIEVITKDGKHIDMIEVFVDGEFGNSGIPLTSISIEAERQKNNEKFIDLFVGEELTLKVSPNPKEVRLPRNLLDYEVEDKSIVEVLPSGKMTALKAGTTKVKVFVETNKNIYDEVTVTVKSTVTGIKGDAKWTLRVGEIAPPPVNVTPVETAQNKDILITHDGKDIIRLVKNKEIEGLKAGVVNATFISEDGGYEHQMQITIISTVTSFKIPFETVKIGLEPYQFAPEFNKDAFLKEVKYEIEDKKIITINAKTNTITPKSEGTTKVRAVTVDGELVDEFEVVVDYEAKQISIYDEKNNLISSSDVILKPSNPSNPNGNNSNATQIRRMILEKLLDKADTSIVREVIKRLLNKI